MSGIPSTVSASGDHTSSSSSAAKPENSNNPFAAPYGDPDQTGGPDPPKLAPGKKLQKPILGYWKYRGIGNNIKFLLEYVGEQYEEDQYASPDSSQRWANNKFQLGMTFPSIPFYLDTDGKRISQSNAILRHLARKYPHVDAKSDDERVQLDILEHCLNEYRDAHVNLVYRMTDMYDKAKSSFEQFLPLWLRELSTQLGHNPWLIGDRITYVDFVLYELLVILSWHVEGCLDKYPNLQQYVTRFEALSAIRKYMQSDRFIATPVYAPYAKWNAPTHQQLLEYYERIRNAENENLK